MKHIAKKVDKFVGKQ